MSNKKNDYDIYGIDEDDFRIDPEDYDFHADENEVHDPNNHKELSNRIDNSCYVNKKAHEEELVKNNSNKSLKLSIVVIIIMVIIIAITGMVLGFLLGNDTPSSQDSYEDEIFISNYYLQDDEDYIQSSSNDCIYVSEDKEYELWVTIISPYQLNVFESIIDNNKNHYPSLSYSTYGSSMHQYYVSFGKVTQGIHCINGIYSNRVSDDKSIEVWFDYQFEIIVK